MTEEGVTPLVSFYGETDGVATTGTIPLDSDVLHESVDYIRPDKGTRAKIWAKLLSGEPCTIFLEQTEDITASPPVWKRIGAFYLVSAGELLEEFRRPITLLSRDGKQAFRFTWSQVTAAKSYIEIRIEFVMEERS